LHLATHCSKKGYLIIRGKTHESSLDSYDMALTPTHIYDICAKIEDHTLSPDIVVLSTCMAMTDSFMIDYVDSVLMALLSCGVSCVVSAICDVDDDSSEEFMTHFYNALLGASELDVTRADTVPMDSLEAFQAASLRQRKVLDNCYFPKRWAGYMFSGLGADKHGPVV
jgi:CHAT domain-containing protein